MTAATDIAVEHVIGATGLLAIRAREGAVRLRAVDGETVRVHGVDDLGRAADIDRGTGSLSIGARLRDAAHADRKRRRLPDLTVDVPTRATVVVETASGDITVDGLRGDQRYRTASGDIRLRDIAGRLSVEAFSGDVEATIVDEVDVAARTVSGDLALRAATIGSLRASTTSGDLKLAGRLAGPGPFSIETVSGDTLLALVGDVRVELKTVAGDMRSEVDAVSESGLGRRSLTIGRTGPTLQIRSMSGDVRLVRPTAVARSSDGPPPTIVVVPATDPVDVAPSEVGLGDAADAARLAILRALERGEIDVTEATHRLEAVDGAAEDEKPTVPVDAVGPTTGKESTDA